MADPVASRSGFLCTYMSNHPDTLVAYVRHFGKITAPVVSATMTSIDTKGMSLSFVMKGTDTKKQLTVSFDPPLSGYEEVKPRLLSMKLDAEESLGMTPRPQITTFEFPGRDGLFTGGLIFFLIYVTFAVPNPSSFLSNFGHWVRSAVGGPSVIKYIWIFVVSAHSLEALWVLRLYIRHSMGLYIGAQYVISTLFFGFPAIRKLRQLIQKARIDSITKIH